MGLITKYKIYDIRKKSESDTPVNEQNKKNESEDHCNDCHDTRNKEKNRICLACNSSEIILIYHKFRNEITEDGICDTYEHWEYKCLKCEKYFLISHYGNYRNFYTQYS
jgi:hypothetical protein